LGSFWELEGNKSGRRGEKTENPSQPIPTPKGKKEAHHDGMLSLPAECREFLFPKPLALGLESRCIDGFMSQGFQFLAKCNKVGQKYFPNGKHVCMCVCVSFWCFLVL
jgi:hypothetical protein